MGLLFGCQTYTWQMSFEQYNNSLDHIMDVAAASGFAGIEAELCMLGDYYNAPERLKQALADRGLKLAALTLALPWRGEHESNEEMVEAEHLVQYLRHFPQAIMVLVQLPWDNRDDLRERQENLLSILHTVSARARDEGIACAFHPNSPSGSLFRIIEDYTFLFERLDPKVLGYAPDSGHIANGGMNPMDIFRSQRKNITHVHFKDYAVKDGWKPMGEGGIDHLEIVRFLRETDYNGWIMVEEESELAVGEPDLVTKQNGAYVIKKLKRLSGKHIVFVCGEDEYKSEQTLAELAREIQRSHDAAITILTSQPDSTAIDNLPGLEVLEQADLVVFYLRFRQLPEEQFKYIRQYIEAGKPIIGFRTSTHAFNYPLGHPLESWNQKFGIEVLGAPWIQHFGHSSFTDVSHNWGSLNHPILKGVSARFFVRSWLYYVHPYPPEGTEILLNGYSVHPEEWALAGGNKSRIQPVAWTRTHCGGGKVFMTTLGHPEDFEQEAFRILIVNGIYWSLDLEAKV
ncbi:hypothetical protein EHS13_32520 [Paenibacillus psychroresistens]|uniref:Sugar phosphate isomerase/epimerase n=1 Tax=Paenibacillus psychroresistens TaxID=1778678 RepID=A0A6B8RUX6_9BACL|nr:TIM barrel protein [Paenibacillus psychroresistens]QGQ99253.1 hypothetical protein EHS13_32520 [Paenibacillus psychroresistens]